MASQACCRSTTRELQKLQKHTQRIAALEALGVRVRARASTPGRSAPSSNNSLLEVPPPRTPFKLMHRWQTHPLPTIHSCQHAKPHTLNPKPETSQPETCNPKPLTLNMNPTEASVRSCSARRPSSPVTVTMARSVSKGCHTSELTLKDFTV